VAHENVKKWRKFKRTKGDIYDKHIDQSKLDQKTGATTKMFRNSTPLRYGGAVNEVCNFSLTYGVRDP
jgi:hypothetical protein